jgi:glycosyltransferase involved in cell wall biosynthesis
MIKISIHTAAFQAAATLARTGRSVLAQTYPHWEWIIASDDRADYEEVLRAQGITDPRIRFASTGRVAAGAPAARNAAHAVAEGEVMAVLDADDTFAPEKLERLLPHVLAHGAATSDIVLVESATGRQYPSLSRKYPAGPLSAEQYLTANLHTYAIQLWDRRRVDVTWDEAISLVDDMVIGACLFNVLPGIYYDPEPLHFYYKHAASMCNTGTADGVLEVYRALIARAEHDALPVRNAAARDALLRFSRRMLMLEEKFFAEPASDPVMGFYYFIARNREAFYSW